MNEAETRAEHIDPALKAAGWGVVEGSRIRREYPITLGRIEGHGRRGKALTADYVLIHRNHKLAVIEAKAWDEEITEGVAQAKNYAGKLAIRYGYSTNGQGIYGIDMRTGKEGALPRYPTPEELWNLTFAEANAWRDRFAAVPFEDRGGFFQSRYYQDIAIDRASLPRRRAFCSPSPPARVKRSSPFRSPGNCLTAAGILAASRRAAPASSSLPTATSSPIRPTTRFLPSLVRIDPEDIRKKGRVPKNGSLFFTIFQTFMSGPPKDGQPSPYFGEYPPDFFDFIVIDECHRGGANDESNWRGILEYFAPAVQLGLTATPKRKDNVDTYAYFGEP